MQGEAAIPEKTTFRQGHGSGANTTDPTAETMMPIDGVHNERNGRFQLWIACANNQSRFLVQDIKRLVGPDLNAG